MWQTTLMNFASQGVVGFVSSFLCTRQVRASNISRSRGAAKSRKIHKNVKNTAKFGRNLIRYMSVQLIWNLSQQIYLETSPLKHANNVLKLPDVDYVAKNWALAMTLKALPLVHFWTVLLKEQMMTSVWKTLKMRVWSANRFLVNFPWK